MGVRLAAVAVLAFVAALCVAALLALSVVRCIAELLGPVSQLQRPSAAASFESAPASVAGRALGGLVEAAL